MTFKIKSTKTDQLLDALRRLGTARTTALAEATGISSKAIPALLERAIAAGKVQSCKVTVGNREQNEYRLGSGVPVPEFVPLKIGRRVEFAVRSPGQGTPPPLPTLTAEPKAKPTIVHPFMMVSDPQPAAPAAAPATETPKAKPVTQPIAESDLLERIAAMTAAEFGEFVGFLSRVWAWKAARS